MYLAPISTTLLTLALIGAMPPDSAVAADPPGRVGRVSYVMGSVSFRPGGSDQWVPASLTYPLTTGAELWSNTDARAEAHVGSSAVRLGPRTLVDFLDVSDHDTQLRLTRGRLYLRVPRLTKGESYEIDMPTGTVSLLDAGTYRIDVAQDGEGSTITVRNGRADITSRGVTVPVHSGESLTITGLGLPLSGPMVAVSIDDWETWAASRDLLEDRSLSLRYVSPELVGFESLDQYGTWQVDEEFGAAWIPTASAGWAPYRFGAWSWVAPWGWTWVDDAPWGFAPFHYGRWTLLENRWAWVPGDRADVPFYAPALVEFLGGAGFDLSLSVGNDGAVAWFPLAPGEIYLPPFRVTEDYIREINVPVVTIKNVDLSKIDVTKVAYRNRSLSGAVTVVSRETFVSGEPVSKAVLRMPASTLAKTTVIGAAAPIAPDRHQSLPRTMARSAARPPAAALNRSVVTRRSASASPSSSGGGQQVHPESHTSQTGGNQNGNADQQRQLERQQVLSRQAAERAALELRQQSELGSLRTPDAIQQAQQRHAGEQGALAQRHQAELQRFNRR
jgi:hypothetical protein